MSLFSSLRKNKQQSASDDGVFRPRSDEDPPPARSRRKPGKKGDGAADPILPEKKRARRRLIGAVALVLAAVVGLPMLLDSDPKPQTGDIVIQIPSRDKVPAPEPVAPPAEAAAGAAAPAARASGEKAPSPSGPATDASPKAGQPAASSLAPSKPAVADTSSPDTAKQPTAGRPAPVAPPAKADATHDERAAPKPGPSAPRESAAARSDDAARARALLNGKPDPRDAEKYVIQVAALATKDKVDELRNRLKNAGIRTYTERISTSSGPRIRVRVGPFSSRDEAEKVRARIAKLGLGGVLVPA